MGAVGFTAAGLGVLPVLVVSRWCLGGISVVSRSCLTGVSVVSRWCLGPVSVVSALSRWCLGGVSVVSRWCLGGWCRGGDSVVSRWCLGGVSVVSRWWLGGVSVVSRWCLDDVSVVVVSRWPLDGVLVVSWWRPWCLGGVWVVSVVSRWCFGKSFIKGPYARSLQMPCLWGACMKALVGGSWEVLVSRSFENSRNNPAVTHFKVHKNHHGWFCCGWILHLDCNALFFLAKRDVSPAQKRWQLFQWTRFPWLLRRRQKGLWSKGLWSMAFLGVAAGHGLLQLDQWMFCKTCGKHPANQSNHGLVSHPFPNWMNHLRGTPDLQTNQMEICTPTPACRIIPSTGDQWSWLVAWPHQSFNIALG